MALSSSMSGALQEVFTGRPWMQGFQENMIISSSFFLLNVGGAAAAGAYGGAGVNGLQARVRWTKTPGSGGALTIGPAAHFNVPLSAPIEVGSKTTFAAHEFGHTIQFIALSALGSPWMPYLGMGLVGLTDTPIGRFWEDTASLFGNLLGGGFVR